MRNRIREFRAREGLTQEQLAQRADVTRMTIVFLEQNKYNPSLRLAHRVAKVLNSSIDQVFIFDEELGGVDN